MGSDPWRQYLARHRGKIVGSLAGLILGLAVMELGILWTLFLALTATIGYQVGGLVDGDQETLRAWLDRLWPPGRR